MNLAINCDIFLSKLNRTLCFDYPKKADQSYLQTGNSHQRKRFSCFQIFEICLLIVILFEHTFIFILTFHKKSSKKIRKEENQYSLGLPTKTFLYCCLHRTWIRAFSFTNMCLSCVYFVKLLLKHYHPNLVHYSSITYYSLPLNLLQQMIINFNTFHLFIISISVVQYFLRYYRLVKNTYSSYFFNGQNLLLTKHTNVALILSSSLALILAYNFVFYTPKHIQTISLLPLVTFNMILLPTINLIIFIFIFICLTVNLTYKHHFNYLSVEHELDNLRFILERQTCIKCYSKILQKNPNLFQDKNYSYKNLYKHFFPTDLHSSYPFQTKRIDLYNNKQKYSPAKSNLEDNATDNLLFQTALIQLNHQHALCHFCYYLLLIFLFKYILLTFPQYILQMIFHLKQCLQFILKQNLSNHNTTYSFYENNEFVLRLCHYLLLLSRFGDSFLLIRLSYFIKKYCPCWCHFNSKLLRKQQLSRQILTMKTSVSSNNEGLSTEDMPNSNQLIEQSTWKNEHRRFRLRFQFIPLWSHNRARLFKEIV